MQKQIVIIMGLVAVAAVLAATYFGKIAKQGDPDFIADDTNSFRQQIASPDQAEKMGGQELATESMAAEEGAKVEAENLADEEAAAKVELAPPPDMTDLPEPVQLPENGKQEVSATPVAKPESKPVAQPVTQVEPAPKPEPKPEIKPEPKVQAEPEVDPNLQSGTVINVSFDQSGGAFTMRMALNKPIDKATYFNLFNPSDWRWICAANGRWLPG